MAARESQGLQISLIVFVLLWLLASVVAFVFVRKANQETARAETAEAASSKDKTDRKTMEDERGQLMVYIGLTAGEKIDAAKDAWEKDMKSTEAYGVTNLPPDQKTYKKLVEGLQTVVKSRNAQLAKQEGEFRQAKTTFDDKTKEYQDQIASLTQDKDNALAEYLKARNDIGAQVTSLNNDKKELVAQTGERAQQIEQLKTQMDSKVGEVNKKLTDVAQQLKFKTDDFNKIAGTFKINANPDGKIIWVNERDRVVFINLGSADGLKKRVTFSVFDPSTTDVSALPEKNADGSPVTKDKQTVSDARKKGAIEVINVTQPHMAECRILSDSTTSPLLPGDLVFTPIWRPGKQDHFAFVGMMDVDGDGKPDRERIHDLIRANGAIIDAEIDEKGNMVGEVTPATRYVVKGSTESVANQTGTNKLIEDATRLGVEAVDLAKFLDMMGYTPALEDDRIVRGHSPTAPSAGEPASNFRPRVPPERGSKGGGF
jgi:hypothetical protein